MIKAEEQRIFTTILSCNNNCVAHEMRVNNIKQNMVNVLHVLAFHCNLIKIIKIP